MPNRLMSMSLCSSASLILVRSSSDTEPLGSALHSVSSRPGDEGILDVSSSQRADRTELTHSSPAEGTASARIPVCTNVYIHV